MREFAHELTNAQQLPQGSICQHTNPQAHQPTNSSARKLVTSKT